jgi:hypothetical protein
MEVSTKMTSKFVKVLSSAALTFVLAFPMGAYAATNPVVNETTFPSTETIINGSPTSENSDLIKPMDVLMGPYFDSYVQNYVTSVDKFRQIAAFTLDNRYSSSDTPVPMSVTITSSTSQGSEFSGSITFTGEVKAGIFGGISVANNYSVKETRTTNEAVGMTAGPLQVPKGKIGHIDMYYRAIQSGGGVKTYTYNTSNPSVKYYTTTPINVKTYKAAYPDVYTDPYLQ